MRRRLLIALAGFVLCQTERVAAEEPEGLVRLDSLRPGFHSTSLISPAQLDLLAGTQIYTSAAAGGDHMRRFSAGFSRQASPSLWYGLPLVYERATPDEGRLPDSVAAADTDTVRITPAAAFKIMDKIVIGAAHEASFDAPIKDQEMARGVTTVGLRLKSERYDLGLAERIPTRAEDDTRGLLAHARLLLLRDLAFGLLFTSSSSERQAAFMQWRRGSWLVEGLGGPDEWAVNANYDSSTPNRPHHRYGVGLSCPKPGNQLSGELRYAYLLPQ